MENEELIAQVQTRFPEASIVLGNDFPEVSIDSKQLLPVLQTLKTEPSLAFNFLFCETCVDWKTHFTMVYHLESTTHRHNLVIKANLDRVQPEIETACHLYRAAELHEREIFDLFGIIFTNHPHLRRILLTDDWVGYPLRKDYDDPINMIKL
ncbi:MAG: NADH-quinone oxidoreductase subunit C [Bacteroidota bacterium]|nr:NADH-quinone oxidoreductase subunit C [Bacteroidota bacterium]